MAIALPVNPLVVGSSPTQGANSTLDSAECPPPSRTHLAQNSMRHDGAPRYSRGAALISIDADRVIQAELLANRIGQWSRSEPGHGLLDGREDLGLVHFVATG